MSIVKLDGEPDLFYLRLFRIAAEMAGDFGHPSGESWNGTVVLVLQCALTTAIRIAEASKSCVPMRQLGYTSVRHGVGLSYSV